MTKREIVQRRSLMLRRARRFFSERGVLEVDCPLLSTRAAVDAHIDLISALYQKETPCFLHSSPEYGMKRLLVEGVGDIYQLSHVFRDGEWSRKHNPEFMMAEWYRLGVSLEAMINETADFIRLFLGPLPSRTVTYRDLFLDFTGLDYVKATEESLFAYVQQKGIPTYQGIVEEGKDALLNLILAVEIEPKLGIGELLVLAYYPASQAALAKKERRGDEEVAKRFEIYYKGVELANGYHELGDAHEQRERLLEANNSRQKLGKRPLPIDERFLQALEKGLPDCCGVAVGFDRLMMLCLGQGDIANVLSWGWQEA